LWRRRYLRGYLRRYLRYLRSERRFRTRLGELLIHLTLELLYLGRRKVTGATQTFTQVLTDAALGFGAPSNRPLLPGLELAA
jgi:hypothetical protein